MNEYGYMIGCFRVITFARLYFIWSTLHRPLSYTLPYALVRKDWIKESIQHITLKALKKSKAAGGGRGYQSCVLHNHRLMVWATLVFPAQLYN